MTKTNGGELPELLRLNRDLKNATATLGPREARYLVDSYYQMQHYRISTSNQGRSMGKDEEPHLTLGFFEAQMRTLENQIKSVLDTWTDKNEISAWAKSIVGIGPVIAAGFLAHIDITKAPTVGHIWSYAGLDPTVQWNKGEKRPWNAGLKVVCWKAGESFVKVSSNPKDVYGKIYKQRKAYEEERNECVLAKPAGVTVTPYPEDGPGIGTLVIDGTLVSCFEINGVWYYGGNAKAAYTVLRRKKIGKDTDAYKAYSVGLLPPAHLHSRAKRYAVKLFLSHMHDQWYRIHFNADPPNPYPLAHLGHSHLIAVPNPVR